MRRRGSIRSPTAALMALLLSFPVLADDDGQPIFRSLGIAPAGFESLSGPQTVMVDVFYGDRPLMSTLATYTPESITFEQPEAVLAAVSDLQEVTAVLAALTGPLPTNASAVCAGRRGACQLLPPVRGGPDCGVIFPETAGVIFDANTYRVDLFVARQYRREGEPVRRKFIPASETGFSFVQNFAGNFAGTDSGSDEVTVSSFSTIGYRENRIVAIASYSSADDLTVDRLFAQRDFEGRQYVGGLFRTSGRVPSFTGENDLLGVRMASTLDTRNDLNVSRGTPIDLFLNSRARVDIIKDGRLISTRFYEAGNQLLDTTNLPEGAYDITIRVTENGVTREETRFFTKSSRVPPKDQALFTLEAGQVLRRTTSEVFPEDTGAFLFRGGYSRRLTESFGFDVGGAATSGDQLIEAGLFSVSTLPGTRSAYYEVQANVFGSIEGDHGYSLGGFLRWGRLLLNLDHRDVISEADPPLFEEDQDFRLIPEDLEQTSVSLQIPVGAGFVSVAASRSRRAGLARDAQGINLRYPLLRTRSGLLELRGDVSRTDGDYAAFVGVRFNFWQRNWSGTIAPAYQYADETLGLDDGFRVDGSASWHDPGSRLGNMRLTAAGTVGESTNRLGTSMDWQHFLGRTVAAVDHADRGDGQVTSYSASINTGLMTDGASWTFGTQNSDTSAIVIDLEGDAPETDFEVLIDGYRRGYAPAGRSTAINLTPFRTYEVRITPRRSGFISFEDRVEQVTLYPGNVERLIWKIADLLVVVGRVSDQAGLPVTSAKIENAHGMAVTDEAGYFQAEVVRPAAKAGVLLEFRDGAGLCRVVVPEFEVRAGVAFLDDLTCRRAEG